MTPDPRLRARRAALVILIWSFFGVLGGVSMFAGRLEAIFIQLRMRILPAPTELFLALGRGVRHPIGFVLCTLTAVGVSALVLRGAFDARLKVLTIATVVGTVLFNGLYLLAILLPTALLRHGLYP